MSDTNRAAGWMALHILAEPTVKLMAAAPAEAQPRYFEAFRRCVLTVVDAAMLQSADEITRRMLDQVKGREGQ